MQGHAGSISLHRLSLRAEVGSVEYNCTSATVLPFACTEVLLSALNLVVFLVS